MVKTIKEINERIRKGEAVVVKADQMPGIVKDIGVERAAQEIDAVTTGTFGAMCSSGAFLNFGHSEPPIRLQKAWLNDVEAYAGIAAVDAYIGATQQSETEGEEYGGGHVIEDLIAGKAITLKGSSDGTDCYPLNKIDTEITIEDLNQAFLFNPRNSYQRYAAAVNTGGQRMNTYMGPLLAEMGNLNYAGTGHISPLINDPHYHTIGFGTRIFLGGAKARIVGEGTQHSPDTGFGNISVKGDMKCMDTDFIRGATIPGYGTSLFVGIGIPIPILNEEIAKSTAITNDMIEIPILDYGVAKRDRDIIGKTTYEKLMSKEVQIDGKNVRTASLSSMKIAVRIMDETAKWIERGDFTFSMDVDRLPQKGLAKPMKMKREFPKVGAVMTRDVHTANENDSLRDISQLMIEKDVDQIPIVDNEGRLRGIVTSFDFLKAHAKSKKYAKHVMSTSIVASKAHESISVVSQRLRKFGYNSTPVVSDDERVIGIITLTDINRSYGRYKG